MGRIPSLVEEYLTGDTLLKNGAAVEIMQLVITAEGATAGQKIIFRNGQDGAAQPLMDWVIEVANGSWPVSFAQGKRFGSGCFVDFQGTAGKIHVAIQYL